MAGASRTGTGHCELANAIAGQSMTRLQQAITKAGQHGVDTTKGRARLTELREAERARAKQAAADELTSAMGGEDMPKLQQAITKAQEHGINTTNASARLTQLIEAAEAAAATVRDWVQFYKIRSKILHTWVTSKQKWSNPHHDYG